MGPDAVECWQRACERGDSTAAVACTTPDVEFVSPLTEQLSFRGHDDLGGVLSAAFTVIVDIACHTRLDGPGTAGLYYRARIGDQPLEEAQLLRLDDVGLIREITLFIRPLPAQTALLARMGPLLARAQQRRGLAAFLTVATAPLAAGARMGDRHIVPLVGPRRGSELS